MNTVLSGYRLTMVPVVKSNTVLRYQVSVPGRDDKAFITRGMIIDPQNKPDWWVNWEKNGHSVAGPKTEQPYKTADAALSALQQELCA